MAKIYIYRLCDNVTNIGVLVMFEVAITNTIRNYPSTNSSKRNKNNVAFYATGGKYIEEQQIYNEEKKKPKLTDKAWKHVTTVCNKAINQLHSDEIIKGVGDSINDIGKSCDEARITAQTSLLFPKKAIKELNKQEIIAKEKQLEKKSNLIEQEKIEANEALEEANRLPEELAKLDPAAEIKRRKAAKGYTQVNDYLTKELKGFEKISGYEKDKAILNDYLIENIKLEAKGNEVEIPGSILLFGPTGNGKSTFANAFIEESECAIVKLPKRINGDSKKEKHEKFISILYNEAEKAEKLFEKENKRTIIFIDEITGYITSDSNKKDDFFEFLKKCSNKYHCTIFATTNFPGRLGLTDKDQDIFPVRIAIEPPNKEDMKKVLFHHASMRKKESIDSIDYEKLTEQIINNKDGYYTPAQIDDICKNLHKENPDGITTEMLSEKINKTSPSINEQIYENFQTDVKNLQLKKDRQ